MDPRTARRLPESTLPDPTNGHAVRVPRRQGMFERRDSRAESRAALSSSEASGTRDRSQSVVFAWSPDRVPGRQTILRGCQRQKTPLKLELEQDLGFEARPSMVDFTLGEELRGRALPRDRIGYLIGRANDIEGMVLARRRERRTVKGVPMIASQVVQFGAGNYQAEQCTVCEQRRNWVHAGTAVMANGR